MKFHQYNDNDKIKLMKHEFTNFVKLLFENPEQLKQLVNDKKITADQSKEIIKSINKFNAMDCGCCRRFAPEKLQKGVEKDLEPILDLVQETIKTKEF